MRQCQIGAGKTDRISEKSLIQDEAYARDNLEADTEPEHVTIPDTTPTLHVDTNYYHKKNKNLLLKKKKKEKKSKKMNGKKEKKKKKTKGRPSGHWGWSLRMVKMLSRRTPTRPVKVNDEGHAY